MKSNQANGRSSELSQLYYIERQYTRVSDAIILTMVSLPGRKWQGILYAQFSRCKNCSFYFQESLLRFLDVCWLD